MEAPMIKHKKKKNMLRTEYISLLPQANSEEPLSLNKPIYLDEPKSENMYYLKKLYLQ